MVEMLTRGSVSTAATQTLAPILATPLESVPAAGKAPTLVLMAGFAGAGKTTLAKRLSYWLGWEMLNKDDLKLQRLAQGTYIEPTDWDKFVEKAGWDAFEELLDLIEEKVVQKQQSIIIDTSNEKPFIFENVLQILEKVERIHIHARLQVVLCVANKETRTARLHRRRSVFEPYVHELPTILDDSELSERFKHLLDDSELPERFKRLPADDVLIVNTNPPLGTYDWKVLRAITQREKQMAIFPFRQEM